MNFIQLVPIKRRRHGTYDDPRESRRQTSAVYTVPSGDGDIVQVCSKTFSEVFSLTKKKLHVNLQKKKTGECIYADKRGRKVGTEVKYTDNNCKTVIAHIQSSPTDESHYTRKKSQLKFVSPDPNIHRMYLAFKEKFPDTNVQYKYYSAIFKKEFPKLRFKKPRKDTCSTCDMLQCEKRHSQQAEGVSRKLELHHRKAEQAIQLMREDKINSQLPTSESMTVCIDLQQVYYVPTLTHSAMYYSRQLSCYNFCVHIGDNDESYMCMWHELEASRGGNEISSCVLKVLLSNVTSKRKLCIWADNCAGQNKNRMMLFTLMLLVNSGLFDDITLKFLVSGHSYMDCDRDFALIEKRKKVTKAFVPKDIQNIVKSARVSKPFHVIEMHKCDFYNTAAEADMWLSTKHFKYLKFPV